MYLARVGEARIADLAARFSVSTSELIHDLELAACCGVPPYTPDQLIDLLIDEDRVVAEGLRELAHPRRFTPEEGLALAAAARALLAVPGADGEGDLASVLTKLEAVLGSSRLAVEVDSSPSLGPLQSAVASGEQVEIDYFGAVSEQAFDAPRRSVPGRCPRREVVPGRVVPPGKWPKTLPGRSRAGCQADRPTG